MIAGRNTYNTLRTLDSCTTLSTEGLLNMRSCRDLKGRKRLGEVYRVQRRSDWLAHLFEKLVYS